MTTDPGQVWRSLQTLWTHFHLPLWVTEWDWSDDSRQCAGHHGRHAEQLDTLYRVAFSHPGVRGILMWGFWDRVNNRPDSCLVEGEGLKPNLAGEAYLGLYHREWRTKGLAEGSKGIFQVRGFLGSYKLRVVGQEEEWLVEVNREGGQICIPLQGAAC